MAGKGLPGINVLSSSLFLIVVVVLLSSSTTNTAAQATATKTEADALLEFKSTLSNFGGEVALRSWTPGSQPCSDNHSDWDGVLCTNGKVWGLQLEGKSLSGQLNLTALATLASLRAISFMNNNFVGPMPEIAKLGALKSLYLSNNQFSGAIPDDAFARTRSLKKVFMSNNEFSGKIPSSLTQLAKLMFLRLDANEFQGEIPDLPQPGLRMLNVSYNSLEGRIPESISDMDQSLFAGNKNLCGAPLEASCPSPASKSKISGLLVGIIAVSIVAFFVLCCCLFCTCLRLRRSGESTSASVIPTKATITTGDGLAAEKLEQGSSVNGGGGGRRGGSKEGDQLGKLSFIKDQAAGDKDHNSGRGESGQRFEMQDLLRASAEVLGSGNFGSSYKAVISNGPSVVVKRYKEMNKVGREDFQEHMRRLGRLSHPNVLPLVAYYYRKEEKLIITGYILNGSLAHMLHGNRGSNLPPLEWPTRLKIVKGVARGLAYLYEELPMLTLPHGHLKSSNVLIDDNYEALLTDYALVPVVNPSHASQVMIAYKSPEVAVTGHATKKSDVWSLGILIVEVLTGKFPATYLQKGQGKDLVEWVDSVAKEELDVFDKEMKETKDGRGQMLKLLQIGLSCCEADVDKRLEMKEALDMIEELKERDTDSSFLSEVELFSSDKENNI